MQGSHGHGHGDMENPGKNCCYGNVLDLEYENFPKKSWKVAGCHGCQLDLERLCSAAGATSLCSLQQQSAGRVCTNYVKVSLQGYICPILKVNPPMQLEKHIRPISLMPVLTKVMDLFTCKWIMECVSEDIDSHQYGSVKGSSTIHALVELVQLWQQALDEPGKVLRVLLLD